MIKFCFLLLISLFGFLSSPGLLAQTAAPEVDSLAAFHEVISFYQGRVKDDSFLDEGREYIGYENRIEGHAFFETDSWQKGNIIYKGQLYMNVPLLYDLVDEEVVVRQYSNSFKIKLFKEEIKFFSLLDHHFLKIEASDVKGRPMVVGFYDRLYGGDTQVLVKRKKKLVEKVEGTEVKRRFEQGNQMYIKKRGEYYPVRRKGSVLKVLKDRKKEVRQFLKRNKIKFYQDPEAAIVKMVEFYDQASTQP